MKTEGDSFEQEMPFLVFLEKDHARSHKIEGIRISRRAGGIDLSGNCRLPKTRVVWSDFSNAPDSGFGSLKDC